MTSTKENTPLCGLNREDFQTTVNGKKTDLYFLRNRAGYEVAITNYGEPSAPLWFQTKTGK